MFETVKNSKNAAENFCICTMLCVETAFKQLNLLKLYPIHGAEGANNI